MLHNLEASGVMNAVPLVSGIFLLAFVAAFIPVASIELALIVAAATDPSGTLLLAQVLAAAAGQMVGKSCFFVGGRTAFRCWRPRTSRRAAGRRASLHRLVTRAMRKRAVGAATVFLSALTGLPPFTVVSALAGGWGLRLPSFFLLGLAGRSARFGSVLMVPHVVAW
jgi:membrane protein YqaA with SNARE-associated domain